MALRHTVYTLAAFLAASAAMPIAYAADEIPPYGTANLVQPEYVPAVLPDAGSLQVMRIGDISYVSGGVGKEESEALQVMQRDFNLRITNSDKTGHYSGNVHIIITDMKQNLLLDLVGGPLVYVNLPKGRYILEGFSEGESKKQTLNIVGANPKLIHFIWPQNFADIISD